MVKIVDPDQFNQTPEITAGPPTGTAGAEVGFDTTNRRIFLYPGQGTLDANDGATLQALYSFCKEQWKSNATLITLPFPFEAITEAKFDVFNGWDFGDVTTVQSIRDAGWSVIGSNGVTDQYFGFITLGLMDNPAADRAYYQQDDGLAATSTVFTGPVNEAVKIFEDPDGTGGTAPNFDYRSIFRAFLREQGKTFAASSLAEQGLLAIDYTVYRLPLANAVDPKITAPDGDITTLAPYTSMSIEYLDGAGFTTWTTGQNYSVNDVVQSAGGRWFRVTGGTGPSAGTDTDLVGGSDTSGLTYEVYPGERQIGTNWFAFNVLVKGANAVAENIYEFTQYQNRQATDINSGLEFGPVTGNTAAQLLSFLGDTLITGTGVYVDNFNTNDTNRIEFNDVNGTTRLFPFVAAGSINFNTNLVDFQDAGDTIRSQFWMFFADPDGTPASGDEYGTTGAILVNDSGGSPITGDVTAASLPFDFDYDGNSQGGRTPGTDADVVIVAIGLDTAQFVSVTGTITRDVGITFSLVSNLERNYTP